VFVKYVEGRELPSWPKSTGFQPTRPILSPKWSQDCDPYHNVYVDLPELAESTPGAAPADSEETLRSS
jgi:hypothetical protein